MKMNKQETFLSGPFDLRRFLLLAGKRMWWLIVGAVLGAVFLGGGYYIKTNMMAPQAVYRSDALYYITFTEGAEEIKQHFYNDYTWNDVLDSDEIAGVAAKMSGGLSKEQIAASTRVPTMSDIHMIHVYVEDHDPEVAEQIQNAIGIALSYFAHNTEDGFVEISQWDRKPAEVLTEKNLISRWIIAGALLGGLCALLGVAYIYVMDDTVRLESDLYRIPGMRERIAGSEFGGRKDAKEQEWLRERLSQILDGRMSVKLAGADGKPAEDVIAKVIRGALPEGVSIITGNGKDKKGKNESEAAATICCVSAGNITAAQLQRLWAATEKKGLPEAVILTGVDHALHKAYYLGRNRG